MGNRVTPEELDGIVAEFARATRAEVYDMALPEYPPRLVVLLSKLEEGRRVAGMVLFDGLPDTAAERRAVMMRVGQDAAREGSEVEAIVWSTESWQSETSMGRRPDQSDDRKEVISVTGMTPDGITALTTVALTRDSVDNLVPGEATVQAPAGKGAKSLLAGAFFLGYLAAKVPPLWPEPARGLDAMLQRMPMPVYVGDLDTSSPGKVRFTWMDVRMVLLEDGTVMEVQEGKEVETPLARFSETFIGGKR